MPVLRHTLPLVGIVAAILLVASGCSAEDAPSAANEQKVADESSTAAGSPASDIAADVAWDVPFTVCEGMRGDSLDALLPPPPEDGEIEIELGTDPEFNFNEDDTVSTIPCVFSSGPGSSRVAVDLIEKESPEAGAALVTSKKNQACDEIDGIMFLYCEGEGTNPHWLTSMRQLGPINVAIKGYTYGENGDSEDAYREKMIALHHTIDELLIAVGKAGEAHAEAQPAATTTAISPDDACALSFGEVDAALSYDDFHTASTEDASTWITAFGKEVLEGGCRYERAAREQSQSNRVTNVLVNYRPYNDNPDEFYPDRATAYAEDCPASSSDPMISCRTVSQADVVVSGTNAFAFRDGFAWQVSTSGYIEDESFTAVTTLIELLAERDPGDRR